MAKKIVMVKTKRQDDPRLRLLLGAWGELTGSLATLEEQRTGFAGQLRDLEENLLPNLLSELGVGGVTAEDGTKVTLKDVLTASVADRNVVEAAKILKRIGADGIAQVEVKFNFTKEEAKQMKALFAYSKKEKVPCEHKVNINSGTLKAVVAKALESGDLQPKDLAPLGVFRITKAVVKPPKV